MAVSVISDQEVIQEAAAVLREHLSPSKAARFWAIWQVGKGDYLQIRDQLFGQETVAALFEKVEAYQKSTTVER